MESFPEAALVGTLQNTWQSSATAIYRNWLQYCCIKKAESLSLSHLGPRSQTHERHVINNEITRP